MEGSVLGAKFFWREEMMLGLSFSSKLNWSSNTVSIAKTDLRKWDPWFMKFLPHEAALYLYYAIIWPCTKYCCHIRAVILDEQQKRVCRTIGPSFTGSLELLAHLQNVICWILFYSYYFGVCLFKLVKLILNPHSHRRSTRYSNIFHNSCRLS